MDNIYFPPVYLPVKCSDPPPSNINQNFPSIADHVLLVTFANLSRNCPCTDIRYVFMHDLLLKGHSHSFAQILFYFFYCLFCFINAFRIINKKLSLSGRVIS